MSVAPSAKQSDPADRLVQIEQAVIGLLMREPGAELGDDLAAKVAQFEAPHDRIISTMLSLRESDAPISPAAIALRMVSDPHLQEIGALNYLITLADSAPAVGSTTDLRRVMSSLAREWISTWRLSARCYADEMLRARGVDAVPEANAILAEAGQDSNVRPLQIVRASAFEGRPVPTRKEFVEGLVPRRNVTILGGDGGTGKSLIALQLAAAVQTGATWLGKVVFEEGPVLFVSAEDEIDEINVRLAAIVEQTGASFDQLGGLEILSLAGADALLGIASARGIIQPTPLFHQIEARVKALQPVLVVFDTLSDLFGGNENDRGQARQFVGMLRGLVVRHDTTVLLLAHPSLSGLNSSSGTSGSTGWNNSARSRLYFERIKSGDTEDDPDARVLRSMKANYGPTGGQIKVRWHHGVFKPVAEAGGLSAAIIRTKAETVFLDMLKAYTAEGRNVTATPGQSFAPFVFAADKQRCQGVTKRGFADALNTLFAQGRVRNEEWGPPSHKRRRLIVAEV